ncbi:MAG: hypothetical protein ACYDCL_07160 [Myxococcales bacterium]
MGRTLALAAALAAAGCNFNEQIGGPNGSSGGASGSGGTSGAGSTGGSRAGSSTGGSSTEAATAGASSTEAGSTGGSSAAGSSTGGELPYGSENSTEYHPCNSTAQCTPPEQCTSAGGASLCLVPCASVQDCHDDELCSFGYCVPGFCGPGAATNAASYEGACTASDQGTGICVPYPDPYTSQTVGICFASGTVALGGRCTPNPQDVWSVPRAESCTPPGLCAPEGGGGICTQSCDPTGTAGAPPARRRRPA